MIYWNSSSGSTVLTILTEFVFIIGLNVLFKA